MRLEEIQAALQKEGLDGWLFFDHHRRDPLAYRVLQFTPGSMVSRRWYYFVPANGEPRGLVHKIESLTLQELPGDRIAGKHMKRNGGEIVSDPPPLRDYRRNQRATWKRVPLPVDRRHARDAIGRNTDTRRVCPQ